MRSTTQLLLMNFFDKFELQLTIGEINKFIFDHGIVSFACEHSISYYSVNPSILIRFADMEEDKKHIIVERLLKFDRIC